MQSRTNTRAMRRKQREEMKETSRVFLSQSTRTLLRDTIVRTVATAAEPWRWPLVAAPAAAASWPVFCGWLPDVAPASFPHPLSSLRDVCCKEYK